MTPLEKACQMVADVGTSKAIVYCRGWIDGTECYPTVQAFHRDVLTILTATPPKEHEHE